MGDRFYQQQSGQTCGALAQVARRPATSSVRRTKADIANEIGCPALEKLTKDDLVKLSAVELKLNVDMPTGRLKKPYLELCNELHDDVDWKKLTVRDLVAVLAFARKV